jgi:cysteine-rich repeat protein
MRPILGGMLCLAAILGACLSSEIAYAADATTTVRITICGDGIASGFEVCDLGTANNTGLYSTSTANRQCTTNCLGFGPYCGDAILQPIRGEECDDGNNTSGDRCSTICKIEDLPSGGGSSGNFSGGGNVPLRETRVTITGKAYPNASVHILKDGEAIGIVQADGKADFYFTTTNVTPGVATFGFWAEDSESLKSVALTTTLTIVNGAVTTISGAFIPPTIGLDKRQVAKGEVVTFSGTTAPQVKVETRVNSSHEVITSTSSDSSGKWSIPFNTNPLEDEEFHTVKSLFEANVSGNVVRSAFSQAVTFYVGKRSGGSGLFADLNGDGRVNLVDFSILLFYWNSGGPIGDLNNDKKVNLTDFSILLFNWTG